MDQRLDGAGGVDDAEGAADQEDVEHDVGGLQQTLWEGQEDLRQPRRVGLHVVERLRLDDLATLVLDAVEAAGRDPVGGDRGQHDQAEQQSVGVGDPEPHVARPQNSAPVTA